MIGYDRVLIQAGAELTKDRLNRHPRTTDHGFPAHDLGIDFDSLVIHHA